MVAPPQSIVVLWVRTAFSRGFRSTSLPPPVYETFLLFVLKTNISWGARGRGKGGLPRSACMSRLQLLLPLTMLLLFFPHRRARTYSAGPFEDTSSRSHHGSAISQDQRVRGTAEGRINASPPSPDGGVHDVSPVPSLRRLRAKAAAVP